MTLSDVTIVGREFHNLRNAFVKPYVSSKFNIFVGSHLSLNTDKWDISKLKCKVYILPRKPKGKPTDEINEVKHSLLKTERIFW